MEDFSLSPEIVLHCRAEIETQCSGLHRKGRTLHCLMRIGRGDRSSTVDSNCQNAVRTNRLILSLLILLLGVLVFVVVVRALVVVVVTEVFVIAVVVVLAAVTVVVVLVVVVVK